MPGKPTLHEIEQAEKQPLWRRLGWLAMIWTGSVLALFSVGQPDAYVHERGRPDDSLTSRSGPRGPVFNPAFARKAGFFICAL